MNTEKNQFVLPDGTKEIIIREGKAPELLPNLKPIPLNISGTINSVVEFLSKRKDQEDQINQKRCYVVVNRENITITLITCENDPYHIGQVSAKLEIYPKFEEFGINNGKVWTPTQLGLFFKMNRAFFANKDENMSLVTELMNFTATINNSIEKKVKENGDRTDNFAQTVNSNLPPVFTLIIPIFKGVPAERLEVETFASVSGREIGFVLLSPAANQTMEEIRDKVIDKEIGQIKILCPDIAIIEE